MLDEKTIIEKTVPAAKSVPEARDDERRPGRNGRGVPGRDGGVPDRKSPGGRAARGKVSGDTKVDDKVSDKRVSDKEVPGKGVPDKRAPGKKPSGGKAPGKKGSGSKGIETMYRNAYRAELDLIALAATKANIMISLNGFIISALMISGGFIYASSPLFLLPATVFLFTSALSVYFALLAASPERIGTFGKVATWFGAVRRREAAIRDLPLYVRADREFVDGKSNVLIYEDRVKLTKASYQQKMRELRDNKEDVYDTMSDQLYWLGRIASTKFRMLGSSYGVFRWGLVLSVLSFLSIKSIDALLILDGDRIVQLRNVGVSRFQDIHEPSAAAQLPDGRLLVVEDEADRAFNVLAFRADGTLGESPALDAELTASFGRELADLEGLTIDSSDHVYAITSHSRTRSGTRSPARERLVRFRLQGDAVADVGFHGTLRDELAGSDVIRDALAARVGRAVAIGDVDIEGLAFDARGESLLVGFRAPTVDGLSLVVTIGNPEGMFENGEAPLFTEVALLGLEGGGIRSLNFDPVLDTYLLVNEVRNANGVYHPRLWSWSGAPDDMPEEMFLPGLIDLKNVESVNSVTVNGRSRLLITSDDGNVAERRPATYMLLEHDQLWRKGASAGD